MDAKNLIIRQATENDLATILGVENDAFPPGRQGTIETFKNRLNLNPAGFFVLIDNNKIVGFTTALITDEVHTISDLDKSDELLQKQDGNSYYLRSLAVMKKHQGKGLGRILIRKQMENARKLGKKYFHFTAARDVEGFYLKLCLKRITDYVPFHNTKQALWKIKL